MNRNKIFKTLFFALIVALTACKTDSNKISLPTYFSDNMVLQQNSDVVIWGKASSGKKLTVETGWGESKNTIVRKNRTWDVKFFTNNPGGPYKITIKSGREVKTINNVYIGEVWLASGQSNMEMPVKGWLPNDPILNSAETITNADYPEIRMFTVPKTISARPLDKVKGKWEICSPETVPNFSATAYYFARKLYEELKIPIGIIHSSWGGTNAESWISGKSLINNFDEFIEIISDLKNAETHIEIYNMWLQQFNSIDVSITDDNVNPFTDIDLHDSYYSNPDLSDDEWDTMMLPKLIEDITGPFDGVAWFRKTIDIPSNWEGQNLFISLGPIDDIDVVWYNGDKIGATSELGKWNENRNYIIDGNLVNKGKALIAIRVIDTGGNGGIYGNTELMKIYPEKREKIAISLAGEWKYQIAAELKNDILYVFEPGKTDFNLRPQKSINIDANTPSVLFNGMISPFMGYKIKGAIWYQGESNIGRASQYTGLMKILINDWRYHFRNDSLPFYFVQIAPYRYSNPNAEESAWIREAQRRTLKVENTGMVVTLDVGNVLNIHPADKKSVGERLAFWALANDYGKEIEFSGPIFNGKFSVKNNTISVEFNYAESGLEIRKEIPNQFEISGDDGIFHPANVSISGNSLVLSSPRVHKPVNARYAFKNGSEASLFNKAGLPAATFTTER